MSKDIFQIEDIVLLVDSFYSKVREDSLLKDIFNAVIKENWPQHLEKMYSFWQTVLLDKQAYTGSPFPPHSKLPITKEHFDRWLDLFFATIDEHFSGEKAEEAKWRAERMAEMFLYKIEYYKNSSSFPVV